MLVSENLLKGSVATDQDSRLSWNDRSWTEHNRTSVKFAPDDEAATHSGDEDEVGVGVGRGGGDEPGSAEQSRAAVL